LVAFNQLLQRAVLARHRAGVEEHRAALAVAVAVNQVNLSRLAVAQLDDALGR